MPHLAFPKQSEMLCAGANGDKTYFDALQMICGEVCPTPTEANTISFDADGQGVVDPDSVKVLDAVSNLGVTYYNFIQNTIGKWKDTTWDLTLYPFEAFSEVEFGSCFGANSIIGTQGTPIAADGVIQGPACDSGPQFCDPIGGTGSGFPGIPTVIRPTTPCG